MSEALQILRRYWQHDAFRMPQEEIISSVLDGRDTFAVMPTGGGKSVCFQIPALLMDGICLVVSPLVALMKDQVSNLQQRGIKAIALTGGISADDAIRLLDNCEFGNFKFLYLSPERLQSDWILERIKNLPVNLIAIDEAHCVSQWGHDFRPAYLKISALKPFFPKVPLIALTASATARVRDDIAVQLRLENPAIFEKSFERTNLAYMVFETEDKLFRTEQMLRKNPGSSIIYVRNRKSCLDVSSQLKSLGFTATFYHGGLMPKEKEANMQRWMTGKVQVIVATNAFGMGIDKPDVKTVIHIQLPENIENYYQEAGRAGRNGEKAFAVLLTSPSDSIQAEGQFISVLPDKKYLVDTYVKLCTYFQIAYGEGIEQQFSLNLHHFCQKYAFPPMKTYNAMQFLDAQGVISLSQEFSEKITVQFLIPSKELIRYISLNPKDEQILLAILRTYPGIYDMAIVFNTPLIAKKSNTDETGINALLSKLSTRGIIDFNSKNNDATLVFNEIREDEKTINRVSKYLEDQNSLKISQLKAVLDYTANKTICRSRQILAYFGEIKVTDCGICSWCVAKKAGKNSKGVSETILELLKARDLSSREIQALTHYNPDDVILALRELLENDAINIKPDNQYTLKK